MVKALYSSKIGNAPIVFKGGSTSEGKANQDSKSTNNSKLLIYSSATVGLGALAFFIFKAKKEGGVNLDPLKCIFITGKKSVAETFSSLKPNDYKSGEGFCANFHIHSTCSDGKLSPVEILNQAKAFADKLPENKKFYFSVTDHDNIDGVKAIFDEIKKDPQKYSKLKFVPGVEISVKYTDKNAMDNSIPLDYLVYGFNPSDKTLNDILNGRKTSLLEKTKSLFNEVGALTNKSLSVSEMQDKAENPHLRHICSNGYLKALKTYVKAATNISDNDLSTITKRIFGGESYTFSSNMELSRITQELSDCDLVTVLAHPGKIDFFHAGLKIDGLACAKNIFQDFSKAGGNGVEANYQSYKESNLSWWTRINNATKDINENMLKSGGYDTHFTSINAH